MNIPFQNSYTSLPSVFYRSVQPSPVQKPRIALWNENLAVELGLHELSEIERTNLLSGNSISVGSQPIAQAYAGHQFGNFTMLGDGRAILLGEILSVDGSRKDIQLKGSGRTPFSRGGDGRATLSSMLREYIISEAMFHLGIPTTRSLSVAETGEFVYRETKQVGGILTRIANSHIRVGTFEYAYQYTDAKSLMELLQYSIQRHYPECSTLENPILGFLNSVLRRQLDLILHWLRVGFIHGVMNTDNMSICGETIDYGPCAFMNTYHPQTVFSSIDMAGRYAFGNQPAIAHWNLGCLANSLLPYIHEDLDQAIQLVQISLDAFAKDFQKKYWEMMGKKIGFQEVMDDEISLVKELMDWMQTHKADYTNTFLALEAKIYPINSIYSEKDFSRIKERIGELRVQRGISESDSISLMQACNPYVIPRNHKVEDSLEKARSGDYSSYQKLIEILKFPYLRRTDLNYWEEVPPNGDVGYKTYCGT